jgi:hypothetical protein
MIVGSGSGHVRLWPVSSRAAVRPAASQAMPSQSQHAVAGEGEGPDLAAAAAPRCAAGLRAVARLADDRH